MTTTRRGRGLAGAAGAVGPTVVVDTLRAFSTAAFLLDAGVTELILTATVVEAEATARERPGTLLCGEVGGSKPEHFDLGNSPGEVLDHGRLDGLTVVQRTSSGTRCLLAAVAAGARPVYAASLVVASPTAALLAATAEVTIVASGRGGTVAAIEDDVTADHLERLLAGVPSEPDLATIRTGEPGERMRAATWAHPADLELCLDVDRFSFAMTAELCAGPLVRLLRTD